VSGGEDGLAQAASSAARTQIDNIFIPSICPELPNKKIGIIVKSLPQRQFNYSQG
jgi:hypothetical protein